MKVKLSIELDLSGTSYNIKDIPDLNDGVISNISSWLYELNLLYGDKKLKVFTTSVPSKTPEEEKLWRDALHKIADDDLKLSSQLFHNFHIEGVTEDGHSFSFTHKEPGYKEQFLIDGIDRSKTGAPND